LIVAVQPTTVVMSNWLQCILPGRHIAIWGLRFDTPRRQICRRTMLGIFRDFIGVVSLITAENIIGDNNYGCSRVFDVQ